MFTITEQVLLERRRAGLTQAQLAAATGLAASNVSAHESGARRPTISTLETIASALDLRLLAVDLRSRRTVLDHSSAIRRQPDLLRLHRLHEDLASVDPATAVVLASVAPEHVSTEWNAAIAGVVEWCLLKHGAPLPRWVDGWGLDLRKPWRPDGAEVSADGAVPGPLQSRNVLVTDVELAEAIQVEDVFWGDEVSEKDL